MDAKEGVLFKLGHAIYHYVANVETANIETGRRIMHS